jgi:Na+/melibiose symporter-like transporter
MDVATSDVSQQRNLSTKEIMGYGFYSFFSLFGSITFGFRAIFYPMIGMNLALFTSALLVARVIDFFVTLAVGGIIEKVNLKVGGGGKYRPWLYLSQFTIFLGITLTFTDFVPGNSTVQFIVVVVSAVLVSSSMSFIGAAQFGLLPMMAGASVADRTQLTAWNYRLMVMAQIFTSLAGAYTVTFVGNYFTPPMNYTVTTFAFAWFYFLGIFIIRRVTKPYDLPLEDVPSIARPKVTVGDMAKAVVTNSQLMIYLLANTLSFIGMMIMMNVMIYYWQLIVPFTHNIPTSQAFPGLYTLGNTLSTAASFGFALFGPSLGTKLGKKRALWIGLGLSTISGVLNFFFAANMWYAYIGISMIGTFAGALFAGFGVQYALDAGEYGLWKTGQDNRLVIMAMTNMPMKIAGFFGMFALYILVAIGFDSAQVQAATAAGLGMVPEFVTDSFVTGYMFVFCGIPVVCNALATILVLFAYKIRDDDAARYAAQNQAWMASRMAAEGDPEALAAIAATPELAAGS